MRHTKETFGAYWQRWLAQRRPCLEAGTWTGYEIHGRKRLLPALAHLTLAELTVERTHEIVADLADAVEAGDTAAKTVDGTLATLARPEVTRRRSDRALIPSLRTQVPLRGFGASI
ncbi:MAG: N-terminal phage integrase SAM-like domain-containing protein [Actinomycetota bacterium]|nr:N-terminal phage integrase SAM-like domain-containing protein [Actinomycetota bacterium]